MQKRGNGRAIFQTCCLCADLVGEDREVIMLDSFKHKGLRRRMVDLLMEKGISDPLVLEAMNSVPRHLFVDPTFSTEAYQDKALPIEAGQSISSPFTVAYQSQLLALKPRMKVLEIGTGSGYQAAVLAAIGAKVFTVEREGKLLLVAKQRLEELSLDFRSHHGDGSLGWPTYQPYERILLTAASPTVPLPLQQQLELQGILVGPIGDLDRQIMTKMTRISKQEYSVEKLLPFQFVPLRGRHGFAG